MMTRLSQYQPQNTNISLQDIENLVSEFTDDEKRYIEILTERVLKNIRKRKVINFGLVQAREIVLRMIVKTNGDVLNF